MSNPQLNHAEFREQVAAALAGGLTAAEQAAFEAHAASCAACAAELARAREAEQRMMAMFAGARPAAGFEDRVVQRLRGAAADGPSRWRRPEWLARPNWVHPAVRRAVTGVAAVIVLGGFGYVATQIVGDESPFRPARRAAIYPAEPLIRQGGEQYGWDFSWGGNATARPATAAPDSTKSNETAGAGDRAAKEVDTRLGRLSTLAPPESSLATKEGLDLYARQDAKAVTENFGGVGGARGGRGGGGGSAGRLNENQVLTRGRTSGSSQGGQQGQAIAGGALGFDMDGDRTGKAGSGVLNGPADAEGKSLRTYYDLSGANYNKGQASHGRIGWFKPNDLGTTAGQGESFGVNLGVPVQPVRGERLMREAEGVDSKSVEAGKPVYGESLSALALQTAPVAGPTNAEPPPTDAPAPPKQPAPEPAPPAESAPQAATTPPAATDAAPRATARKIIRNGTVEFEVERYDSAFAQVVKLVQEAGGYVGTTDSEKLPNGKVRGTVTVRVPPDRLDTLVLQLRGIGDLRSQKLEAQDVSKKYSDLDSELRAARAMEERLLGIIKEGKGQIKDLLAAEKELGVWRTKIEQITGELRYFDNLVAMSTLNITLFERDIRTPATAIETETIDAGVESEDVEKARADALKSIEEAKGRVIQSDLKRYDAGQFGATIVAEVPPDRAGPLMDRLKQIGKVARLDVQRKQSTPESQPHRRSGDGATQPPVKVERRDTRLNLSLYNLANVAPRQTTVATLAADDVEQAYRAILDRITKAGGRVVTSNVARSKPEQTTGTISFETPSPAADAVLDDVRALGDVMKLSVTENPDVQNVTTAKRGFNVSLVSTASVAPRETVTMQLAATDVAAARDKILQAAGAADEGGAAGTRVLSASLSETDKQNATAKLDLDVKRAALPAIDKALADAGQTISRQSSRSTDTENTLDSKLRLTLTVVPADQLPPRETTTMAVELRDVEAALGDLQATAATVGGRVVESNLSKDREGRSQAKVAVEVPLDKAGEVVKRARELGVVRAIDAGKNLQVPTGPLSRARIDVTFGNADAIVAPDHGIWASIRRGLSTSIAGLAWSVQLIVIGLCFVLPWALILWGLWKWMKRRTRTTTTAPAPVA